MTYYNMIMPKRSSKNPKDINELAKFITDSATDPDFVQKAVDKGYNLAAVFLGRAGGLKGGKARAKKLSAERRKEIAQQAAQARWRDK